MQKTYGSASHGNIRIELASNNSHGALGTWIFTEMYYDVAVDYQIQLRPEHVDDRRHYIDTLWAQIINRDRFERLRTSPKSEPMTFTIISVRRWKLQRNGLRW